MTYTNETKKRTHCHRQQIVEALRKAGDAGLTSTQLNRISIQFGSRLSELYAMGYQVEVTEVGDGLHTYQLISEPDTPQTPKKAVELLINTINQRFDGNITSEQIEEALAQAGLFLRRNHGGHRTAANL